MIKFSVGIPAYKYQFFTKCIESILNQTYQNFELIIVNDSSPNDLGSIVKHFKDERIKYFENEKNIGAEQVVKNWNKCLEHASGDYFVLMGDDDIMAPNYLEEFVELIHKYPNLDVYHCRTMIIDEDDKPKILTSSWPEFETVYDNIWHRLMGRRSQYISDFVYRTKHLKEYNGFFFLPMAWGSDDITAYRACAEKGIAHTNKPVFKYRSNSFSITSTGSSVIKMDATLKYFNWLTSFLEKNAPLKEHEIIMYVNLKNNLGKCFERKKANILTSSLKSGILKNIMIWLSLKSKYTLTNKQLFYSLFLSLKNKFRP